MPHAHPISGDISNCELPDWGPLETLLGSDDLCGHFMWMFQVTLADGRVLQVYKHSLTRRYMHLGADGAAYYYSDAGTYQQVAPWRLLLAAFETLDLAVVPPEHRDAFEAALDRCPD